MIIIFCIILSLIGVPSIKVNCLPSTELPALGAGYSLTITTNAAWIQTVEGVSGCYNPKRIGYVNINIKTLKTHIKYGIIHSI
jgi:hypothetical protein